MMTLMLLLAQDALAPDDLRRLPVREVTIFKDGHALLLHEGAMPVDKAGNVVLDGLPAPVIGTFWAYASDPAAAMASVVASRRIVRVERDPLNVAEAIEAHGPGEALIRDTNGERFWARVLSVSTAGVLFLETPDGVRALPRERVADITFKQKGPMKVVREEPRDVLSLRLDWAGKPPAEAARVGMMYLQKGLRWIPSYQVELDGQGKARLKLQATLLNELADLEDVTAHLVIGVPSFFFKDTTDPLALQKAAQQLSSYFQTSNHTGYAMSNAMVTQVARAGEHHGRPVAADPGPDAGAAPGAKNEDLYVFPVRRLTLRKGEVAIVKVAEFTLDYKDVYALDLPITPPEEVRRAFTGERQTQLARLLRAPKAVHRVRLSNTSGMPLTTSPALLVAGGRVLGQSLMTYTPPGGRVDLDVTAAVDILVKKTDVEKDRLRGALRWRDSNFDRIELTGRIALTNTKAAAVEVEVTRHVLGEADAVGQAGQAERLSAVEGDGSVWAEGTPEWWGWYGWPWWWGHLNPVSRLRWTVKIEPGKSIDLDYAWHYFWN